jgi:hypothetical protein
MPTIINNPRSGESSDSFVSTIVGIIILVVLLILFFVYALPAIMNSDTTVEEQKVQPTTQTENDTLDVNVNLPDITPNPTPEVTPTQ